MSKADDLYVPKTAPVEWGRVKAVDVDALLRTQSEGNLDSLFDMLISSSPPSTASKKDVIQLFRVTQLLLELTGLDADDYKARLEEAQRSAAGVDPSLGQQQQQQQQQVHSRRIQQLELELKHKAENLLNAEAQIHQLENEAVQQQQATERAENECTRLRDEVAMLSMNTKMQREEQTDTDKRTAQLVEIIQKKDAQQTALQSEVIKLSEADHANRAELAILRTEAEKKKTLVAHLQGEVEELRLSVAQLENTVQQTVTDRDAALAHVELLSKHTESNTRVDAQILQHVEDTVDKWKHLLGEKDSELAAAKEVITQLQRECAEVRSIADIELEAKDRVCKAQLDQLRQQLASVHDREARSETTADKLVSSLRDTSMSHADEASRQLQESQRDIAVLRAKIRKYESDYGLIDAVNEIKALEERVEAQKQVIATNTVEANAHLKEIDDLLDENTVLRQRCGVVSVGSAAIEQLRKERREQAERLKHENAVLRDQVTRMQQSQQQRHSGRQRRLKGVHFGGDGDSTSDSDAEPDSDADGDFGRLEGRMDHLHKKYITEKRKCEQAEAAAKELRQREIVLNEQQKRLAGDLQAATEHSTSIARELRVAESQLHTSQHECVLLRSSIRQMAQQLNSTQYAVGQEGGMREYNIHCEEVKNLIAFYDKTMAATASSSGTVAVADASSSQRASVVSSEASVKCASATSQTSVEGTSTGKSVDAEDGQTPQSQAEAVAHRDSKANKSLLLFGKEDLVSMYQSDLLALRAENARLTDGWKATTLQLTSAQAQKETLAQVNSQLERKIRDLEAINSDLAASDVPVAFPAHVPPSAAVTIETLTRQLVEVMHEADVKQELLERVETSLQSLEEKYAVLTQQKRILYQQFNEEKSAWEQSVKEKDEKLVLFEALEAENKQWKETLDTLTRQFGGVADSSDERKLLADLARKHALASVNNTILERRYKLLDQQSSVHAAVAKALRQRIYEAESEGSKRILNLEAQVDKLMRELGKSTEKLAQSVPSHQMEALQSRCTSLAERYRSMLDRHFVLLSEHSQSRGAVVKLAKAENLLSLYDRELSSLRVKLQRFENNASNTSEGSAPVVGQDVLQDRIRDQKEKAELYLMQKNQAEDMLERMTARVDELDKKTDMLIQENLELKEKEAGLLEELAARLPVEASNALKNENEKMGSTVLSLEAEVASLRKTSQISAEQAQGFAKIAETHENEVLALREQLVLIQTEDADRFNMAKLHHKLLTAQMKQAETLRQWQQEKRKVMLLKRDVDALQLTAEAARKALIESARVGRSRFLHIRESLFALRAQYAGAIPLSEQEKRVQSLEDVIALKVSLESEVSEAKEKRENAQKTLDALQVQQEQYRSVIAQLGMGKDKEAQVQEWRKNNAHLRLASLELQRKLADEREKNAMLTRMLDRSRESRERLEQEAVSLTQSFEEREVAWFKREEELEHMCFDIQQRLQDEVDVRKNKKLQEKYKGETEFMPDINWPIGRQLEHARNSIAVLLEQRDTAATHKKAMHDKLNDQEVAMADMHARVKQLEKRLHARQSGIAAEDEEDASPSVDQEQITLRKYNRMKSQYDLIVKTAQNTIASMQNLLDERDGALAAAYAKIRELHEESREKAAQVQQETAALRAELQEQKQRNRGIGAASLEGKSVGRAADMSEAALIADLRRVARDLQSENEVLKVRTNAAEEKLSAKEEELDKVRADMVAAIDQVEGDVRSILDERDEILAQNDEMEQRIAKLEVENAAYAEEVSQLRGEYSDNKQALEGKLESAQRKITNLSHPGLPNVTMAKLRTQLASAKASNEELRDSLKVLQNPSSAPETVTKALRPLIEERVAELQRENEGLRQALSAAKGSCQKAESSLEAITAELEELKKTKGDLKSKESSASAVAKKFENDAKRMKRDLEAAQKKAEALQRDLATTRQAKSKAAESLRELQEELRLLKGGANAHTDTGNNVTTSGASETRANATLTDPSSLKWEADKKQQRRLTAAREKLALAEKEARSAREQNDSLRQTVDRLKRERDQLKKKERLYESVKQSGAEVDALKREVLELRAENAQLLSSSHDDTGNHARVALLEKEIAELKAQAANSTGSEDASALKKEVLELKAENLRIALELEQLKSADEDTLLAENAELKRKLDALSRNFPMSSVVAPSPQKQKQWGSAKRGADADARRVAVLESEVSRFRAINRDLTHEVKKLKATQKRREEEAKAKLQAQATAANAATEEHEVAHLENKELRDRNEELAEANGTLSRRVSELARANEELRGELEMYDPSFFEAIEKTQAERDAALREIERLKYLMNESED